MGFWKVFRKVFSVGIKIGSYFYPPLRGLVVIDEAIKMVQKQKKDGKKFKNNAEKTWEAVNMILANVSRPENLVVVKEALDNLGIKDLELEQNNFWIPDDIYNKLESYLFSTVKGRYEELKQNKEI